MTVDPVEARRWGEIDRLFAAALERPVAERLSYVAEVSSGDPTLAAKVSALLEADARARSFLEGTQERTEAPAPTAARAGADRRIGPYRLLHQIGVGGMGAVYLAARDDDAYRRLVAIKLLRQGIEDAESLRRFHNERQILARLEHPNIARLYDGGTTEDGRPFLVMELIHGASVDQYCRRERLPVAARLELFRQVCAAVQHAHRNLLVHRDIKPSNILVTAGGTPKLLDFGVAKLLVPAASGELAQTTAAGSRPMTLRYASPEQVRGGSVTTSSDVYSLGVVLYELLTGCGPYRLSGDSRLELEQAICEQEPLRPSLTVAAGGTDPRGGGAATVLPGIRARELRRQLRGDLDNIVLKALRKEPEERYGSAEQLSADLGRHLAQRPVSARPATLRYRAVKFLRRNRIAAAVTAVSLGLILVLSLGFAWRTRLQAQRVAWERQKAEKTLTTLIEVLKSSDPRETGLPLDVADLLDGAAERVSRELVDQPVVQAALRDAIGQIYASVGDLEAARRQLEAALELKLSVFGDATLETAATQQHLGDVYLDQAEYDPATALLRQALSTRRALLGDDHPEVAYTLESLAIGLGSQGDAETAEGLHREALAIRQRTQGPDHPDVAESLQLLANQLSANGEYTAAVASYRQALAIEIATLGGDHPDLAVTGMSLALALGRLGELDEAEALLRDAVRLQRRVLGPDHPELAKSLHNLAWTLHRQGRAEEAIAVYRESLAISRERLGEGHMLVAASLNGMASALMARQEYARAEEAIEKALAIHRRIFGERHRRVARSLDNLGRVRHLQGDLDAAETSFAQAVDLMRQVAGAQHPDLAGPLIHLARVHLDLGRARAAAPLLTEALDIRRGALPADHWEVAVAEAAYGDCLLELGRLDEAETLLARSHALLEAEFGSSDQRTEQVRASLAELADRQGRRAVRHGPSGDRGE